MQLLDLQDRALLGAASDEAKWPFSPRPPPIGSSSGGNVRKSKLVTKDKKRPLASLSTDEVLERIQQQMAEVMASAQEAASSAVTNESEARAVYAGNDNIPTTMSGRRAARSTSSPNTSVLIPGSDKPSGTRRRRRSSLPETVSSSDGELSFQALDSPDTSLDLSQYPLDGADFGGLSPGAMGLGEQLRALVAERGAQEVTCIPTSNTARLVARMSQLVEMANKREESLANAANMANMAANLPPAAAMPPAAGLPAPVFPPSTAGGGGASGGSVRPDPATPTRHPGMAWGLMPHSKSSPPTSGSRSPTPGQEDPGEKPEAAAGGGDTTSKKSTQGGASSPCVEFKNQSPNNDRSNDPDSSMA